VPAGTPSQGLTTGSPQPLILDELAGVTDDDPGWAVSLEDSGAIAELVGTISELVGAIAELSGAIVELVGAASELLGSSADEMASIRELLTGSWLSGISTVLLELLAGETVSLDVSGSAVSLELAGEAASLEDSGSPLYSSGATIPPSGSTSSSFADELSSQAFSVKAAAMPSVAAMALLAVAESGLPPEIFLFSIFITTLPKKLHVQIRPFKGRDHAGEHSRSIMIGTDIQKTVVFYGSASRSTVA